MIKKIKKDGTGWEGWVCGYVYEVTSEDVEQALRVKSKTTGRLAAVITDKDCLYGWGYTDSRYKDGPYWWPFHIKSDKFNKLGLVWVESRERIYDRNN